MVLVSGGREGRPAIACGTHSNLCSSASSAQGRRFSHAGSIAQFPPPSPAHPTPRPAKCIRGTNRGSSRPRRSRRCASPARWPPTCSRLAGKMVAPGVTTEEIDVYVHNAVHRARRLPVDAQLQPLPEGVCTSVNEVICHGIPDSRAAAVDGDIVNIDVTALHRRRARRHQRHVLRRRRRRRRAASSCGSPRSARGTASRPSSRDVRSATSAGRSRTTPRSTSYGVVRAFIGHGIGEQFHGDIQVLHYYDSRANDDHAPRHDVHDRADDHPRHVAAQDAGTTTGPPSPPTASGRPSSSTRSSSPTTATTC